MEFLKIPEVIEFILTFKDLAQSENGHSRNKLNSITGKKKKKMKSFSHLIFMDY